MKMRNCGHPLTPENTRNGNRGCKRCALDRRIAELQRIKLPKAKAREAKRAEPPKPETPKPWMSDYEYGLAIVQQKREERQALIRAGMDAHRERFESLPEKERRQLSFMAGSVCHR